MRLISLQRSQGTASSCSIIKLSKYTTITVSFLTSSSVLLFWSVTKIVKVTVESVTEQRLKEFSSAFRLVSSISSSLTTSCLS